MSLLDNLIVEADRQLRICNACRYCEGYCAVFPALERRTELSAGEIAHLSNLCHDCRACYYACMYAPPHEFAINPPEILSKVRVNSYDAYLGVGSSRLRKLVGTRLGSAFVVLLSIAVVVIVVSATQGLGAIWHRHSAGSPYDVLPYGALLAVMLVPFVYSVGVMLRSAVRYWTATHGPLRELWNPKALREASANAAQLRYLKGGGADCYFPGEDPSPERRMLHMFVAYGFVLCLVSTVSAGIMQDIIGWQPPYGLISVPVLCGLIGGIGLALGTTGMLAMKLRADPEPSDDALGTVANYGLVVALDFLALTGLASLLFRHQAGFGILLGIHLSAVVLCFLVAPYTRFVHFIYRYLALVQDAMESAVVD